MAPSPGDIDKILNTLRKLPLWLFLGLTAAAALLLTLDWLGKLQLTTAFPGAATWTWITLVLAGCLAIARGIQAGMELTQRRREVREARERLRFIPLPRPCYWGSTLQRDGSYVTQISVELRITNVSDTNLLVAKVRLIRPKPKQETLNADLMLPAEGSPYFSPRHKIPARSSMEGRVHIMVGGRLGRPGKPLVVTLGITDHFDTEYEVAGIELRSFILPPKRAPFWKQIVMAPARLAEWRSETTKRRAAAIPPTIWTHGGRFANIDAVLNEELRHYTANGRQRGGLGTVGRIPTVSAAEGHAPRLLADLQAARRVGSNDLDLLVRLHAGAGQAETAEMSTYLLSHLNKISPFANVAYFIFLALHRAGRTVDAIRAARTSLAGDQDSNYSNVLATLALLVEQEYPDIPDEVLEGISAALEGDAEYDFALRQRINAVRVRRLEHLGWGEG